MLGYNYLWVNVNALNRKNLEIIICCLLLLMSYRKHSYKNTLQMIDQKHTFFKSCYEKFLFKKGIYMEMCSHCSSKCCNPHLILKLTYGLLFVIAGADKFLNMVTIWPKFISAMVLQYTGQDISNIIRAVGIFEITLGLIILSKWTRLGAFVAAAWLLVIAVNLLTMGYPYDIAVRDVVMAMGALALSMMSCKEQK